MDEKQRKQVEYRVKNFLKEGSIKTKGNKKFAQFFLKNSKDSLDSANALFILSTNRDYQDYTKTHDLRGFLWVINASYYSMFYTARALLDNDGIELKNDLSIHMLTFDALVYFFYLTGKLEKRLFEFYVEAKEEASELLGQQTADELIDTYFFEKNKRSSI